MLTKYDGIRIVHNLCQAFGSDEAEYRNGYLVSKAPLFRLEYSPFYHWNLAELGREEEYLSLPYPEVEELLCLYKEVKGTNKKIAVPSWVGQPFISSEEWLARCVSQTRSHCPDVFQKEVYDLYIQSSKVVNGIITEEDYLFLSEINFFTAHALILKTIWEKRQVRVLAAAAPLGSLTTDPILLMMAVSE